MRKNLLAGVVVLFAVSGCTLMPISQEARNLETPSYSNSSPGNEKNKKKKLIWPVSHRTVTRGFIPHASRPHDGIDISAPAGARIFAPASGTVVYAGKKFNGYGKMVIIEHQDKMATVYGHLQKLLVRTGEKVHLGSLIGNVGRTGNARGYHLHFEVRKNYHPIDPMEVLPL